MEKEGIVEKGGGGDGAAAERGGQDIQDIDHLRHSGNLNKDYLNVNVMLRSSLLQK